MIQAFKYKPRFRDIRIKPPRGEARQGEQRCEYPGCGRKGEARAPKAPDRLGEYYWFCKAHAADYNKSWDFFDGMKEGEAEAFRQAAAYGHRPTWSFKGAGSARKRAERASKDWSQAFYDPFSLFGDRPPPGAKQSRAHADRDAGKRLGRLQAKALETLGLDTAAAKADIRRRYAELVRRFHPDSNGGDRAMEDQLQRVVHAYQVLKKAGMG